MEQMPGEEPIRLMASSDPSERCLHFHPGSVPDLDVEKGRLYVRGKAGARVVRGFRAAGPPTKGVVFASPALCESITKASANGEELDAYVSTARWSESLRDSPRGTWITLSLAACVFVAGLAGALGGLIGASAPIGVAAAVAVLIGLGVGARALSEIRAALKIDCP